MFRFLCVILVGMAVVSCSSDKKDLAPTQIVDGKSIIIPPEFDVMPEGAKNEK